MLVGAAIVPTAPVLVGGVSARLPNGVARVRNHVEAALERLPEADLTILIAAGPRAVHDARRADLAGIGRPDLASPVTTCAESMADVARVLQYRTVRESSLPLGLAVLALLLPPGRPILPVTVPSTARFEVLAALGTGLVQGLAASRRRIAVVAAGDCSAGLTEQSPLYRITGAREWDERAVAAVVSARLTLLADLGPTGAQGVGALGWAPMVVLHGACARAKMGLALRHYSAPRGVGYLVAFGQ